MATASASEFLDRLAESGILSDEQVSTLRGRLDVNTDSGREAADVCIDEKLLTDFQAKRLLAGDAGELVIAGRYQIRKLLGSGGMGDVYLARDEQLDRLVAIKVLPPQMVADADAVARFEREAKAMAKLSHPNIVGLHDSGTEGDKHFLVMEYVEGQNLAERLQSQGRVSPARAADYAYQTALGLDHAHGRGLVHRDLKPSNLLVRSDRLAGSDRLQAGEGPAEAGHYEQVKILDLGLAKFLQDQITDETLTLKGTGLGTPDYMAPEQFDDARRADERSDIYALGCTLYHMLAGRVPFPGSSLSEKAQAHQDAEPPAIEDYCPDVPTGLTEAVYRMLAKRPAGRFASAREAAEALLPYVARSSGSLPNIRATTSWQGSQLTIITSTVRRRRTLKWSAIGSMIAVVGIILGFGLSHLWDGERSNGDAGTTTPGVAGKTGSGESSSKQPAKVPDLDPWLLTVAQDGTAQYRTISEAMRHLRPGMTLRVLDAETYNERLSLKSPSRHSGVTLEAPAGATLLNDVVQSPTIAIIGVPDVTVRGFQMHSTARLTRHFEVRGDCSGLLLDRLTMSGETGLGSNGVEFFDCRLAEPRANPIVVQHCRFRNVKTAVGLVGGVGPTRRDTPCSGIVVRNNEMHDLEMFGVISIGEVMHVHVVGNRIWNAGFAAVQMQLLSDDTDDVLIANNTIFECAKAFFLLDEKAIDGNIQIRNNLVLAATGTDFVHAIPDKDGNLIKAGELALGKQSWTFTHNWREGAKPTGSDVFARSWIPPGKHSRLEQPIGGLSRDSADPDFLGPAGDSPLATEGAGKTDPALPSYIGAVPPEGIPAWDWSRTWRMPPGKHTVLTVSKDPENGAKYNTINAALKDARPWDTIRVVDAATYVETVDLSGDRFRGLGLEAPHAATLQGRPPLINIENAADVRVSGFRLRASVLIEESGCVRILQACPGTVVARLKILVPPPSYVGGIHLSSIRTGVGGLPVVVRDCDIDVQQDALLVGGGPMTSEPPRGGVIIRDNRITSRRGRGIQLQGDLARCLIAGNLVRESGQVGIQIEDPGEQTREIYVANNSVATGNFSMRAWSSGQNWNIQPGQVAVTANVFHAGRIADVIGASGSGGKGRVSLQLTSDVARSWQFSSNWRDTSGPYAHQAVPMANRDHEIPADTFVSRDPENPDFLKPKADSPLAIGGGGGDLPTYAGAVPPEGARPWDWEITWRSRMMRVKYFENSRP